MSSRSIIVGMYALLAIGALYILSTTLYEENRDLAVAKTAYEATPSIPIERGVFTRSGYAMDFDKIPSGNRTLDNYYDNRAFDGGPPLIPHPVLSEKGIGGKTCLQCHQNGGYVDQFKAFAPVTPHPEMLNCKQCHLPVKTNQVFKASNWDKIAAPSIHQVAMPGAPPMIPHSLQMRDNCLSCHAGPAAPKEIRTSHPERINCRQCHLPINTREIFEKPTAPFTRPGETPIGQTELKDSEVNQISEWINNSTNKKSQHE